VALLAGTVVRAHGSIGVAGLYLPLWFLGAGVYPALVQRFKWRPTSCIERRTSSATSR
jgi:hypothetical protein